MRKVIDEKKVDYLKLDEVTKKDLKLNTQNFMSLTPSYSKISLNS